MDSISEIKKEKELLEKTITKAVHDFQNKTKISVTGLTQYRVGATIAFEAFIKI